MAKVAKLARLAILMRPLKNRLFVCKAAKVAKMAKICANVLLRSKRMGRGRKAPSPGPGTPGRRRLCPLNGARG